MSNYYSQKRNKSKRRNISTLTKTQVRNINHFFLKNNAQLELPDNPHSTFGKYFYGRIDHLARKYRLQKQKLDRIRTELDLILSRKAKDLESTAHRLQAERRTLVVNIVQGHFRNDNSSRYLKRDVWSGVVFIATSWFGLSISWESMGLFAVIVAAIFSYLVWTGINSEIQGLIEEIADELIVNDKFKEKLIIDGIRKREEEISNNISQCNSKIKSVSTSINQIHQDLIELSNHIFSNDKILFVLSDNFYNSTDWRHLRAKFFKKNPKYCKNCGKSSNLQVDHIKPRSKFPELALEYSNLQILCQRCNSSKGNKI